MKYLDELKKLNLPADGFAVFGSGPLAIRGWRENEDIDAVAKESVWQQLSKEIEPISDKEIKIGNISIFRHWRPWFDNVDRLIDEADIFEGIRFVKLERVLQWKQSYGRDKDQADIVLIKKFLDQNEN